MGEERAQLGEWWAFWFYENMHFLHNYSGTDSYVIQVQHILNSSDDNEWLYIIKIRKITHFVIMLV